jgi:hypothetical protein
MPARFTFLAASMNFKTVETCWNKSEQQLYQA